MKDKFVDWTWKSASDGDAVYGIPWDSGPMGLLYRDDIFTRERPRACPETWDAYAEAALKLAKDKPGTFMTDFAAGDAGWVAAVLWQKGWRPFHLEGTNISIAINDQIAKDWANYWQKLIDAKAVDVAPVWTSEWFAGLDNGTYASWVTAAWGPALMASSMKESVGKWRAAKIPQWKAGEYVVSNWGGSTVAAMAGTPNLEGGDALRHVHGRRSGGRALLEQRDLPLPGASRRFWPTRPCSTTSTTSTAARR